MKAIAAAVLTIGVLIGTPAHAEDPNYCDNVKFSYQDNASGTERSVMFDYPEGSMIQGISANDQNIYYPWEHNTKSDFFVKITHRLDPQMPIRYTIVTKHIGEYYDCSWEIKGAKPKKFACDQVQLWNAGLKRSKHDLSMMITLSFPIHVEFVSGSIGNSQAYGNVVPNPDSKIKFLTLSQYRKTRPSKFSVSFLDTDGTTCDCSWSLED